MSVDYLLHESPVGYAIFKVNMQSDTVGARLKEVQEKAQNLGTFGKMVQLVSFTPFSGASEALENQNDISEGIASNLLKSVLEMNLPKSKKQKVVLGVQDRGLAGSIKAAFPYVECETAETSALVADMLRNLRLHAGKLLKQLQEGDVERAQLGLGHAYSRAKVKFSVQKNDNHIIQAIATLDHLDKAVNTFSMRVREWYSWHFPELIKLVSENQTYARVALFVGDKTTLSDDKLHDLAAIVNDDESLAQSIIDAARVSMGRDMSDADMEHVMDFAKRAVSLAECRKGIHAYLVAKMGVVAPNTASLIGEMVGARLISKAGSLTNLAKLPASTVQILGAEKALFRALKTKGNTPKYGLIYHSSLIGRSAQKNKGRISRFLANKTSIASRIDNFSEVPTSIFGQALREQVEERLEFFASGAPPTKNEMAMKSAMDTVLAEMDIADPTAGAASDEEMAEGVTAQATQQKQRHKKDKKEKKSKKSKTEEVNGIQPDAEMMDIEIKEPAATSEKKEKKEKKEKRHSEINGTSDAKSEKKKRKHGEVDGESKKKKKKNKYE